MKASQQAGAHSHRANGAQSGRDLLAPLLPAGEPVEGLLRRAQYFVPGEVRPRVSVVMLFQAAATAPPQLPRLARCLYRGAHPWARLRPSRLTSRAGGECLQELAADVADHCRGCRAPPPGLRCHDRRPGRPLAPRSRSAASGTPQPARAAPEPAEQPRSAKPVTAGLPGTPVAATTMPSPPAAPATPERTRPALTSPSTATESVAAGGEMRAQQVTLRNQGGASRLQIRWHRACVGRRASQA
jgi:hypothetical protein